MGRGTAVLYRRRKWVWSGSNNCMHKRRERERSRCGQGFFFLQKRTGSGPGHTCPSIRYPETSRSGGFGWDRRKWRLSGLINLRTRDHVSPVPSLVYTVYIPIPGSILPPRGMQCELFAYIHTRYMVVLVLRCWNWKNRCLPHNSKK